MGVITVDSRRSLAPAYEEGQPVEISSTAVKELREKTGAGVMDCKKALQEANGDFDRAVEVLRERGAMMLAKKLEREANQGIIDTYIHAGGRIGAMVELNCETDFVARTEDFRALAHDIAMQVAAMSPKYVRPDEVADGDSEAEHVLLTQPFIKDSKRTIEQLIHEGVSKLGENIQIRRFVRFEVGAPLPGATPAGSDGANAG
jgi:elongation factor Ts